MATLVVIEFVTSSSVAAVFSCSMADSCRPTYSNVNVCHIQKKGRRKNCRSERARSERENKQTNKTPETTQRHIATIAKTQRTMVGADVATSR